jgi:hypothetical protein
MTCKLSTNGCLEIVGLIQRTDLIDLLIGVFRQIYARVVNPLAGVLASDECY